MSVEKALKWIKANKEQTLKRYHENKEYLNEKIECNICKAMVNRQNMLQHCASIKHIEAKKYIDKIERNKRKKYIIRNLKKIPECKKCNTQCKVCEDRWALLIPGDSISYKTC